MEAAGAARVLGAYGRACNLINSDGEVLTLVMSETSLPPFGAVVDASDAKPFRGLWPGQPVRVSSGHVEAGGYTLEFDGAVEWNPMPDWPGISVAMRADLSGLQDLTGLVRDSPRRPAECLQDLEAASLLTHGLQSGDEAACVEAAHKLAGLGPGLTPAGDDFLVGAMLAAWAGLCGSSAVEMCWAIAEAAAPRTTALSGAYLRAAGRGACAYRWHALFGALASRDRTGLEMTAGDLLAVGHTSGADALAGFCLAAGLERITA
jgi:hypothetical protein